MSKWDKTEEQIKEAVREAGEAVREAGKILDSINLSEKDRVLALSLGKKMNAFMTQLAPAVCLLADEPAEVILAATASLLARQQAGFDAARKAGLKV